jgi:hypothetical protein
MRGQPQAVGQLPGRRLDPMPQHRHLPRTATDSRWRSVRPGVGTIRVPRAPWAFTQVWLATPRSSSKPCGRSPSSRASATRRSSMAAGTMPQARTRRRPRSVRSAKRKPENPSPWAASRPKPACRSPGPCHPSGLRTRLGCLTGRAVGSICCQGSSGSRLTTCCRMASIAPKASGPADCTRSGPAAGGNSVPSSDGLPPGSPPRWAARAGGGPGQW